MALSQTTTLQVPSELGDAISRLAEQRGTTTLDVVTEAVNRLDHDEWWAQVRGALDGLSEMGTASYQAESRGLDAAAADGLGDR